MSFVEAVILAARGVELAHEASLRAGEWSEMKVRWQYLPDQPHP